MARYEHVVFVCSNTRPPDDPRGSCAGNGSAAVLDRLRAVAHARGLRGRVRITSCGCLDLCSRGPALVVFSAGAPGHETWYTRVRPEDADELIQTHLLEGRRLTRLVSPGS